MKFIIHASCLITVIRIRGTVQDTLPFFTVTANKEILNVGEKFTATFNVPDETVLNIVNKYFVKWYYEDEEVAYFSDVPQKFTEIISSKVSASPTGSNVTIQLIIKRVTKSNEGRYSCKIIYKYNQAIEETKSVNLLVRTDIKNMDFKFYNKTEKTLTLSNSEVPHRLDITPGNYSPSCEAGGSTPKPTIKIMMGDMEMKGRMIELAKGRKFQANPYKFPTRKNELEHKPDMVKCVTMVPGDGPEFKSVRTYHVVSRVIDPQFMCTNSTAQVNDRMHQVTCKISGVEDITCNKVLWEDRAKGKKFTAGKIERLNITCNENGTDTLVTTLEIETVLSSDFMTTYAVIYNDSEAKTTKYNVFIIPELSSGIRVKMQFILMLAMFMTCFLL